MIFDINEFAQSVAISKKKSRKTPTKNKRQTTSSLTVARQKSGQNSPAVFKIIKRDDQKRKRITKIIFDNFNLNKNSARVLLALLYWSSGAKYPSSNFVAFSNSDSNLVKTFLNLLRKTFDISEPRIKIHLQLYSTQDKKKMTDFWSKHLSIPSKQFYQPTVTEPPKRPRPDYFGTCTVRYHSLELLLTIMELCEELKNSI